MPTEGDTLLEAQYYCRQTQVRKIIEEVEEAVRAEQNNPAYSLLEDALSTPPVLFQEALRAQGLDAEIFFEKVRPVVVIAGKSGKTLATLYRLLNACHPHDTSLREVSVDYADTRLPEELQALYKDRIDELKGIGAQCAEQASINVMNILGGEVPLAKFRRDLAQTHLGLTSGFGGTEIASIPTKIPNVDLTLAYIKGANFPQASLLVKPFS